MTGEDEHGRYEVGVVISIQGPEVIYRLGVYATEFYAEPPNLGLFSLGQKVKAYQSGLLLPL
jgi:hypothetical protein